MDTGNGDDTRGIAQHIVKKRIATGEDQIATAPVGKGWQRAGRAENEIERSSLILVERMHEALLILHLFLSQLPVVQGIVMPKVLYLPCQPLLSSQAQQATDRCKSWARTLPKEEQRDDA